MITLGPIALHKGQRDAVWALDILRCLYDDLHLVIVGTGPHEERLRSFVRIVRLSEYVHFTGSVPDVRPWLARAEVVWVPSCARAAGSRPWKRWRQVGPWSPHACQDSRR